MKKKTYNEKKTRTIYWCGWLVRVPYSEFICEIFRCITLIFAHFETKIELTAEDAVDIIHILLCHFKWFDFWNVDPLQCQAHALSNSINVKWCFICAHNGMYDACAECSLEAIIFIITNEYQWNIFYLIFSISNVCCCRCLCVSRFLSVVLNLAKPVKYEPKMYAYLWHVRWHFFSYIKFGGVEVLST